MQANTNGKTNKTLTIYHDRGTGDLLITESGQNATTLFSEQEAFDFVKDRAAQLVAAGFAVTDQGVITL